MSLEKLIGNARFSEAGLSVEIPHEWTQGRTGYGGITAALCLAGAHRLADGRPLRSAMISFVGPSAGEVTVDAEVVRAGRNTSNIRSRLNSSLGPGVDALFNFSANRDSVLAQLAPRASVGPPTPKEQALPFREGAPEFMRQLEVIWAYGAAPFSGADTPHSAAWVRHRDVPSRDHPLALMCLADAMAPAISSSLANFAPLSSMNWMIDFYGDQAVSENGWWLLEVRSDFATGGHSSQDMTIWNAAGECVAKGRQMISVFA